jgi:hypothetical protein
VPIESAPLIVPPALTEVVTMSAACRAESISVARCRAFCDPKVSLV